MLNMDITVQMNDLIPNRVSLPLGEIKLWHFTKKCTNWVGHQTCSQKCSLVKINGKGCSFLSIFECKGNARYYTTVGYMNKLLYKILYGGT